MATQPPATEEVVEEPAEPLKYKTWVLKVSVHCEGCKRKVKKILHGIEGVYTVDVDTKLHKATVTGNVDSEILIRKLEKSGKHAELWPEKNEQKESKKSKKKKDKKNDQDVSENNNDNSSAPAEVEKPGPARVEVTGPPSQAVEVVNSAKPGGSVQFKEVRVEGNKPENLPAGENPHAQESDGAASKAASNEGNGGAASGGGSKRKKKKKGGNGNGINNGGDPSSNVGNGNGNNNSNDGPAHVQSSPQSQGPAPGPAQSYCSPPRTYHAYGHPPSYYAPPPPALPAYAVSYSTTYPTNSYTAACYASPPPYSYAYVHQGSDSLEGGPSPSDTFEMFSDENPNACSVM